MYGLWEDVDANLNGRGNMNERELLREYGIVRVIGYLRRVPPGTARARIYATEWVRTHYRASPGTGPLGEP